MTRTAHGWRRALGAAAVLAATGALAACGSNGDDKAATSAPSDGSGNTQEAVAEAQAEVDRLSTPVAWKAPGPPIDDVAAVKGKTLYYIANGLNIPYTTSLVKAIKEASAVVGLDVTVVDAEFSAAKAASLMDQGIGQKADIIGVEAQTVDQLTAPLKAAKAAGIPVIMSYQRDPSLPTAEEEAVGMSAQLTQCYSCAGKAMAAFVVADSKADANVVVFAVPEQSVAKIEQDGFESELKRLCPNCKSKSVDLPIAQWQTNGQSLTSSVLKSDPTVNYLVPMYDGVETFMEPAIRQLSTASEVKVVSLNASRPQMERLAENEIVAAEVGFSIKWAGWATVDQALRLLTGAEPSADSNIALRLFTAENIGEIDPKGDEADWYGPDIVQEFSKLWGLGG